MGPAFKLEFPEVKEFVRFASDGNTLMKYKDREYYEDNFITPTLRSLMYSRTSLYSVARKKH